MHEISSLFLGNTFHRPGMHTHSNLIRRLSRTSQSQNQGPVGSRYRGKGSPGAAPPASASSPEPSSRHPHHLPRPPPRCGHSRGS
uniref:Uncharacterized protein n=1 Tax=Arundo donax TaxID=35708 RepID=A0A0A9D774_ARUDO